MRPARTAAGELIFAGKGAALPSVDPAAEPEVWVLTPLEEPVADDLHIGLSNPDRALEVLRENLAKLARIREFRELGDAGGGAAISVDAILMTPVQTCEGQDDCESLGDLGPHRIRNYLLSEMPSEIPADSLVTFRIKNQGPRDYYIYVLSSGPDGEIGARFPDPRWRKPDQFALLKSGERFDLFTDNGRQSAIRLSIPGEEVVKIIASSQPIRTELLEQEGLRSRGTEMTEMNAVERLLASAQGTTRGNVAIQNDAYSVKSINLNVVSEASN
jgi:hypothetical protein